MELQLSDNDLFDLSALINLPPLPMGAANAQGDGVGGGGLQPTPMFAAPNQAHAGQRPPSPGSSLAWDDAERVAFFHEDPTTCYREELEGDGVKPTANRAAVEEAIVAILGQDVLQQVQEGKLQSNIIRRIRQIRLNQIIKSRGEGFTVCLNGKGTSAQCSTCNKYSVCSWPHAVRTVLDAPPQACERYPSTVDLRRNHLTHVWETTLSTKAQAFLSLSWITSVVEARATFDVIANGNVGPDGEGRSARWSEFVAIVVAAADGSSVLPLEVGSIIIPVLIPLNSVRNFYQRVTTAAAERGIPASVSIVAPGFATHDASASRLSPDNWRAFLARALAHGAVMREAWKPPVVPVVEQALRLVEAHAARPPLSAVSVLRWDASSSSFRADVEACRVVAERLRHRRYRVVVSVGEWEASTQFLINLAAATPNGSVNTELFPASPPSTAVHGLWVAVTETVAPEDVVWMHVSVSRGQDETIDTRLASLLGVAMGVASTVVMHVGGGVSKPPAWRQRILGGVSFLTHANVALAAQPRWFDAPSRMTLVVVERDVGVPSEGGGNGADVGAGGRAHTAAAARSWADLARAQGRSLLDVARADLARVEGSGLDTSVDALTGSASFAAFSLDAVGLNDTNAVVTSAPLFPRRESLYERDAFDVVSLLDALTAPESNAGPSWWFRRAQHALGSAAMPTSWTQLVDLVVSMNVSSVSTWATARASARDTAFDGWSVDDDARVAATAEDALARVRAGVEPWFAPAATNAAANRASADVDDVLRRAAASRKQDVLAARAAQLADQAVGAMRRVAPILRGAPGGATAAIKDIVDRVVLKLWTAGGSEGLDEDGAVVRAALEPAVTTMVALARDSKAMEAVTESDEDVVRSLMDSLSLE